MLSSRNILFHPYSVPKWHQRECTNNCVLLYFKFMQALVQQVAVPTFPSRPGTVPPDRCSRSLRPATQATAMHNSSDLTTNVHFCVLFSCPERRPGELRRPASELERTNRPCHLSTKCMHFMCPCRKNTPIFAPPLPFDCCINLERRGGR